MTEGMRRIMGRTQKNGRGTSAYEPYDENDRPHSRSPPVFLKGDPDEVSVPMIKITEVNEV